MPSRIEPLIPPNDEPITPEQSGVRPIPYSYRRIIALRLIVLLLPLPALVALVLWLT